MVSFFRSTLDINCVYEPKEFFIFCRNLYFSCLLKYFSLKTSRRPIKAISLVISYNSNLDNIFRKFGLLKHQNTQK